jgi:hypothetical protein
MILRAKDVVQLQYFLMDGAKRYALPSGAGLEAADDLLASAAALDYALLLASENGGEHFDDASPAAASLRESLTRAALAALDFLDRMLRAPDEAFDDFAERHVRPGGIFDVVRALREGGVLDSAGLAFRAVTVASDVLERRDGSR